MGEMADFALEEVYVEDERMLAGLHMSETECFENDLIDETGKWYGGGMRGKASARHFVLIVHRETDKAVLCSTGTDSDRFWLPLSRVLFLRENEENGISMMDDRGERFGPVCGDYNRMVIPDWLVCRKSELMRPG